MAVHDLPDVTFVSPGRYATQLSPDFANSKVIAGGYVASILCKAATVYFDLESTSRLPHTYNFHLELLRPNRAGPTSISIEDVRKGSGLSTVRVLLRQGQILTATGFFSHVDLARNNCPSCPSKFDLSSTLQSPASLTEFENDTSKDWIPMIYPDVKNVHLRNLTHWKRMVHKDAFIDPGITDQFVAWKYAGVCWTNEWLPHLLDNAPMVAENFLPGLGTGVKAHAEYAKRWRSGEWSRDVEPVWDSEYWYPTLNLSLEMKKELPSNTRWLFTRTTMTKVSNGRFATHTIILDEEMDVVAEGHSTTLVKKREWVDREDFGEKESRVQKSAKPAESKL